MTHVVASETLLTAILQSTDDALLSMALDGSVQSWSSGAEKTYGYTAAEAVGMPLNRLIPLYDQAHLVELLQRAEQGELASCETVERIRKDGSKISLTARHTLVRNLDGVPTAVLEIAKIHNGHGVHTPTEQYLQAVLEQMPMALWTTDQNLQVTSTWGSAARFSKIRRDRLVGHSICEYLESADWHATPIAEHHEALQGASPHFEFVINQHVLDIRVEPLRDSSGEIVGCIGVAVDVTDRKRSEDEVRFQATHDALTGLANYREFVDTLEREIRRADRSRNSFSVMLMDLDGLKKINDRLGHLAGNRSLKRLAMALQVHCRSTDLAARYGGDEFAVILIDSSLRMAEQVAGRIENHLKKEQEQPLLSASIGISVYPEDGRTTQDLLEAADRNLYRRKKERYARGATAS